MPNILDHVSSAPLLEIDNLPRSATCKEWFAITRRIVLDTIADMKLNPAADFKQWVHKLAELNYGTVTTTPRGTPLYEATRPMSV